MRLRRYHSGNEIAGFPKGWNAQTDGSIRPYAPFGFVGVEIVSPVLKGEKGLTEVVAVVDWLNSVGAKVDEHCGLHVHVGASHLSPEQVQALVNEFRCYERVLYALCGEQALSRYTNSYCKNSSMWHSNPMVDRYQSLNLTNLTGKGTVEFRLGAGTLDVEQILSLVIAYLSLVAKVSKSPRRFAPRPMNLGEFISNVVSKFSPMDLGGDYGKFEELVSQSMMF